MIKNLSWQQSGVKQIVTALVFLLVSHSELFAAQNPIVKITEINPNPALVNELVTFFANASDPDGTPIVSAVWNFGDGTTGTAYPVKHAYKAIGTYTITLTVKDSNGGVSKTSTNLKVMSGVQTVRVSKHLDAFEGNGQNFEGEFFFARTTGEDSPLWDQPLTINFSVSGTATEGIDYVAIPHSVTIPAKTGLLALKIFPVNDALKEGQESLIITILPNPAYVITPGIEGTLEAEMTIHDDELPSSTYP